MFYVLLTVHLGSVLVNNQLDPHLFFVYIYSNSLHVSSTPVLIIMRFFSRLTWIRRAVGIAVIQGKLVIWSIYLCVYRENIFLHRTLVLSYFGTL
jgi:hypothetical protein